MKCEHEGARISIFTHVVRTRCGCGWMMLESMKDSPEGIAKRKQEESERNRAKPRPPNLLNKRRYPNGRKSKRKG